MNCVIVLVDDEGTITYSYANLNKNVTMIGALRHMEGVIIDAVKEIDS